MTDTLAAPMREFLVWVARSPRTYADVIDAWGSHCPRYTVWEDALAASLVEVCPGPSSELAPIKLTPRGLSSLPD